MILKAGTVVTCPSCGAPQIKTTKELSPGEQAKSAGWESAGFDMSGDRAGCYKCATLWVRKHPRSGETQFHTEAHGWVSLVKNPDQQSKTKIITRKDPNSCLH